MTNESDATNRPWANTKPGQLLAQGHGAGDILEAYLWKILDEQPGLLELAVHLPEQLKNPMGQLFGGFTPTYVDMVSLHTVHSGEAENDPSSDRAWLTTINMRCDYFEPIVDDVFIIRGELVNQRGLTSLVSAKFLQRGVLAAHALTTLREVPNV